MRILMLLITALLCAGAFGQQNVSQPITAPLARPSDLSAECHVEATTRTVTVTIINRTSGTVRLRFGGPMVDYEVDLRSTTGERLRRQSRSPDRPWDASITAGNLASKGQYTEKVPLDGLVEIPNAGGTFQVRVGRGLLALRSDPTRLDPASIVWCKSVDVIFPPLK